MTTYTENGNEYIVNPSINDMYAKQVKGLASDAKDPSDYLRLVARTFSSFKDKVSSINVTSYINGFEVSYETGKIDTLNADNILEATKYHIFRVNPGACFINNQFIEFTSKFMFYKTKDEFMYPASNTEYKDYAIIVTYGYIDQYNDSEAKILIVPMSDLEFPLADKGDNFVCAYKDSSLTGGDTTINLGGTPGFVIAKFSIMGRDGIICTTYKVDGVNRGYNRIDPQQLDKLYILNYKKLFEYFGMQAESVFSTAGLTQATFINIDPAYLDPTVKNGDFVRAYQDDTTKLIYYKPALASRQKFDQVCGLYLYNYKSGNHVIYLNGLVTITDDHGLPITHILNKNLEPNRHYYMENSASIYDDTIPVVKVGDLALADNSGRITTRYYNGSVMVGTATACNQILININHSMEIGVQSLLELFGDNSTFDKEIKAQKQYQDAIKEIAANNTNIAAYTSKNTLYTNYVGTILTNDILVKSDGTTLFPSSDTLTTNKNKVEEVYRIIYNMFTDSTGGFDNLKSLEIFSDSYTSYFSTSDANQLRTLLTGNTSNKVYNGSLYKLLKIVKELQVQIKATSTLITNSFTQNNYVALDFSSYWAAKQKAARLVINDNPDIVIDNFENPLVKSEALTTYSTELSAVNTEIINLTNSIATQASNIKAYHTTYQLYQSYYENLDAILEIINSWITMYNSLITTYTQNTSVLTTSNTKLEDIKTAALANIVQLKPLALDIFHMDEFQRKVFNYTYVSDRLKRALYYVDILQIEFDKTSADYTYIYNNHDTNSGVTSLDKILVAKKLENITNKRQKNLDTIAAYKIEFNTLRNLFGLPAFTESQFKYDMDPGEMVDERLGQYRFGFDDHTNCINGLCENLLDECKGIIYDEFAIVANQTDINLGKLIDIDVNRNTVIDLFRITDNMALDANGNMIIPTFTLTTESGSSVSSSKLSIKTEVLSRDKYIVGTYPGYQVKLNVGATANVGESVFFLKIDTTQHVNTLKLNIKVL